MKQEEVEGSSENQESNQGSDLKISNIENEEESKVEAKEEQVNKNEEKLEEE